MSKHALSKRQLSIFDFICDYAGNHGYPPSVREIGDAVGLASPSTVHMHLKVLEDAGLIKRDPKKPRTIEICSDGDISPIMPQRMTYVSENPGQGTITLPLVGRVAAGTPILAEENIEEHFTLPVGIVGDRASFILKVRGVSMIKAGINDGDYIVVKEQHTAFDGDTVVALIDDSATVKTFYRERGRIRLQPENDAMEPIYCENPEILGVVVGLFRRL